MRHVHSLGFEVLEARKLLSKAHVAAAHAAPAMVAAPLVLDGTLTVDNGAATTTMNDDGSTTTTVPVAGRLGALGEVRGLWDESIDASGNYAGPDTLSLHDPKGKFFIAFNNLSPGKAHPMGHRVVYYEHPQRLYGGKGAYAHASESGTIELVTNAARTHVASMVLAT